MQPQRCYLDANGVRYSYLAWGPNADEAAVPQHPPAQFAQPSPVLLVHGFAQSAKTWDTVANLLAAERNVYAIDLVGHGQSQNPGNIDAYTLPEMGSALLSLATSLPAPPLVIGYSLGGRVALSALAEAGPDTFAACASGLVLESAGLGMPTEADRAAAAARDAATVRRLREQPIEEFMASWENLPLFASQKQLPQCVRDQVRAGRLANDPEALALSVAQAGQHAMPARSEIMDNLRKLASSGFPVSYVVGGLDAKYAGMAKTLADELGEAVAVHGVPDAGHNVHLEDPKAFVACIRSMP